MLRPATGQILTAITIVVAGVGIIVVAIVIIIISIIVIVIIIIIIEIMQGQGGYLGQQSHARYISHQLLADFPAVFFHILYLS